MATIKHISGPSSTERIVVTGAISEKTELLKGYNGRITGLTVANSDEGTIIRLEDANGKLLDMIAYTGRVNPIPILMFRDLYITELTSSDGTGVLIIYLESLVERASIRAGYVDPDSEE